MESVRKFGQDRRIGPMTPRARPPQPVLFEELRSAPLPGSGRARELAAELADFRAFGTPTAFTTTAAGQGADRRVVDTFVGEFWTSASCMNFLALAQF